MKAGCLKALVKTLKPHYRYSYYYHIGLQLRLDCFKTGVYQTLYYIIGSLTLVGCVLQL